VIKKPVLCPSARGEKGAILLGLVQANGGIAYIPDELVIDDEFLRIARAGRTPEKRFRFSARCATTDCKQWTGDKCGVPQKVLEHVRPGPDCTALPNCSIRPRCRWWRQEGEAACHICPQVITDLTTG